MLGLWMDSQQMERIEAASPPAICVLAWQQEDTRKWKENHGPIDPRTNMPIPNAVTSLSQVVGVALSHLPSPSAGLVHPNDKAKVVGVFKLLVANGKTYDPGDVRRWAVSKGGSDSVAAKIEDYATRILQGRRVSAKEWRPKGTFELWLAESDKTKP